MPTCSRVVDPPISTWRPGNSSTASGAPAIRDSFELITALFDAGERDLDKVWRRAGVELATPDDRATADSVTVALSYSDDGGATWTALASQNLTSSSGRLVSIGDAISARPESRFLQLKVAVSSVSAWCPVIVGLWAEHETMDLPTQAPPLAVHGAAEGPGGEAGRLGRLDGRTRSVDRAVGLVGLRLDGDVQRR